MRNRLDSSNTLEYMQLLFLTYKDGAPMMTIGGVLTDKDLKEKILQSAIFRKYVFISQDEDMFTIDIPKLTNKEIQLILKNIPLSEQEFLEREEEFFGITYDEIKKFEKIYRYYPYYTEGCFNT